MSQNSEPRNSPIKLRFILSHPVQYFSPLFRQLAKQPELDFEVWYCSEEGVKENKDIGFGTTITWDIPLLEGYKYRFFPNLARRASIHYGFMGLWNPDLFKAMHADKKNTVYILHGWNYTTHLLVLLRTRLMGHYLILRGDNPDHHDRLLNPFKRFLKQLVLRPLLYLPHRILYAGKRNFLFFKLYGVSDKTLSFAPHSVDNLRFRLSDEDKHLLRKRLRFEYKIPETAVVVISPAKFIPKKRLQDIIRAVAETHNQNIYLVLAGEGQSRDFLQNLANELLPQRVILTGFINQSEMPAHYAMSDILCLASGIGETWGLAVNEGMNAELPVIISDLCGCAEDLVVPGLNGYIYPCGEISQLAFYINELADNPEKRIQMGKKSISIVDKYSIEATTEGIQSTVINLIRKK